MFLTFAEQTGAQNGCAQLCIRTKDAARENRYGTTELNMHVLQCVRAAWDFVRVS